MSEQRQDDVNDMQNASDLTTTQASDNDQDFAAATTTISPIDSRGVSARYIAGFAAAGLLLAGVVGAWTLQSSNDTVEARQRAVTDQTSLSQGSSPSSSASSSSNDATAPASEDRPRSSAGASPQDAPAPVPGGSQGNRITPLGNDPYLPPNAWNGADSGTSAYPTETVYAEPTNVPEPSVPASTSPQGGHGALEGFDFTVPGTNDRLWDLLAPGDRSTSRQQSATPSETVTDLPPQPTDTSAPVHDDVSPGAPDPTGPNPPAEGRGPTDTTGG